MRKIEIKGITHQELMRILFYREIELDDGDLVQATLVDKQGNPDFTVTYRFDAKWDTPDYLQYRIVLHQNEISSKVEPII